MPGYRHDAAARAESGLDSVHTKTLMAPPSGEYEQADRNADGQNQIDQHLPALIKEGVSKPGKQPVIGWISEEEDCQRDQPADFQAIQRR